MTNYCKNCGEKLEKEDKFCKKCGHSIEQNNQEVIDIQSEKANSVQTKDSSKKPSVLKNSVITIVGILAFFAAYGLVRGIGTSLNANTLDGSTWKPVSLVSGKSSVDMPCVPTPKTEKVPVNGFDIPISEYICTFTEGQLEVDYVHFPENSDPSNQHAILDGSANGVADLIKGSTVTKDFKVINGLNAVDYQVTTPEKNIFYGRVIIAGHDMYGLIYTPANGTDKKHFDRLVNSLKLN